MTAVRQAVLARIRSAVEARRLTPEQVAQRARVHPRTVQRLLDGETFSLPTVEAVATALRLDLGDSLGPPTPTPTDRSGTSPSVVDPLARPVVGWKAAAAILGVHADTIRAVRVRAGQADRRAWWGSPKACLEWFTELITIRAGVAP